jgi:hypothetical protein
MCQRDFDEVRRLVEGSYAGYADKVARLGRTRVDRLAQEVAARTSSIEDSKDPACSEAIRGYIRLFDDGHLALVDLNDDGTKRSEAPQTGSDELGFAKVSARVVVLRLPSFENPRPLEDLVDRHRLEIRRSEHLIIDLRGNVGGSDESYQPLMKYIYTGPFRLIGVDILATEDNASAWERIVPELPDGLQHARKEFERAIAIMRAHPGEFVQLTPDRMVERDEVLPLPRRISIFHDDNCASSCEQFLLAARHSDKVTTYGRSSAGVLDYANVRYAPLPSTTRVLTWPTTRSRRLPDEPVDGVGIAPDVHVHSETLSELEPGGMDRLTRRRR